MQHMSQQAPEGCIDAFYSTRAAVLHHIHSSVWAYTQPEGDVILNRPRAPTSPCSAGLGDRRINEEMRKKADGAAVLLPAYLPPQAVSTEAKPQGPTW